MFCAEYLKSIGGNEIDLTWDNIDVISVQSEFNDNESVPFVPATW